MIQCFVPSDYESSFTGGRPPRLLSASKIDSYYTTHPRVLHKHDNCFEILFVRSGKGIYIVEETRYPIQTGDLILCNAGILHDEDPACSENLNTLSVAVTDVQLPDLPPNHMIDNSLTPVFTAGEFADTVSFLMMTIYTMLACEPKESAETCQRLTEALMSLLRMIMRKYGDQLGEIKRTPANIIAAQVKNYINAHYDEDFTLQDISAAIHVNPHHLAHVFKEQTGYSPKQYTIRRRLGEAQTLLITTRQPITQIATSVGFGNPCHFDSIFSKYIGMTPSRYRDSYVDMPR